MKKKIRLTEQDLNKIVKLSLDEMKKLKAEQDALKEAFRRKHRQARNLNEDVMYRYWGINRTENYAPVLIEGITVDRLMKKHGDNGYVILSANRTGKDEDYNTKATQSLISDLKNSGFSYLPSYGGYHGSDDVVDSYEPSFIVFNYNGKGEPQDWNKLYSFALEMCGKYHQDSVYVNAPGEAPNYLDSNGQKINSHSSKNYVKNDLSQEYYTSLSSPKEIGDNISKKSFQVGRRFTSDIQFENRMYVNPMPDQLSERMRRKGEVMIWDI